MALSKPMRLDRDLVEQATAVARRQKRTVPRQIEYWAELGRAVGEVLDPDTLIAVREGLARIEVEAAPSVRVDAAEVLGQIESMRSSGQLAREIGGDRVHYQASAAHPGLLEELTPDGGRRLGRFRDGLFVALDER
ncbi:MAG: hypothetical protein GXP55_25425 [Deltaproteobacteria bacterium]|nr:hypothetical protein [Deltaproteobacteria bacterium]